MLENVTFDALEIGRKASFSRSLDERTIALFAACSGDVNPVHLDAEYAASTDFGERIGHGMWVGAVVSAALGTVMPGPGSIYLSQDLKFREPVRLGDTITVNLEVTDKKERRRFVTLACEVVNQDGKKVATGTALVIAPTAPLRLPRPEVEITGDD